MYGQDADSVLPIRGSDRLSITGLVPPSQETVQIRAFFLGVLGNHIQKGLHEYLFRFREVSGEVTEEPFGYLVQGLPGDRLEGFEKQTRPPRSPQIFRLILDRHTSPISCSSGPPDFANSAIRRSGNGPPENYPRTGHHRR